MSYTLEIFMEQGCVTMTAFSMSLELTPYRDTPVVPPVANDHSGTTAEVAPATQPTRTEMSWSTVNTLNHRTMEPAMLLNIV